jgi:uncharacterized protein YnzC (UPF0291/DUF896 family)
MYIARYKKGFLPASKFNSKLHFGNVYCPDCGKVKVKLVRKSGQKSYFEFVVDENEHDELCPRKNLAILDSKIKELVLSDSEQDMSRINYLVNKNLERCINLLTKLENKGKLSEEDTLELMPRKQQLLKEKRIKEFSKTDLMTIHAIDLADADISKLKGKHVVVYGRAGISSTIVGDSVKLLFKINQDSRFSVFVAPNQVQYLNFEKSVFAKFAVFGKLKMAGKFISLEIRSTRDLIIQ